MAGIKRRSRNNGRKISYNNYKVEGQQKKNKEIKAIRHEKNTNKAQSNKIKRLELFNQVCESFGLKVGRGSYLIKRLIGTPNTTRLNNLLDGSIIDQEWFKERRTNLTKSAKKMLRETSLSKFI